VDFDTVVIGGGQAGLTMSHALSLRGRPHVVLERGRIAERWRSERWDSLRFQFPNWAMRLPGLAYDGDAPDEYAPRDDVVRFIEAYAARIRAPVRTGVEVRSLRPAADGFALSLPDETILARNVVIATGPYQRPVIPDATAALGDIVQLTASAYRNPEQLPPGGVLVVGAGASGCQIAEELLRSGRRVVLSVGAHRRIPRRYRGRDIIWWITALGLDDRIADEQESRKAPLVISGAYGGQTVDLRRYAAAGMRLVGRVLDARDGVVSLSDDLADSLAAGDAAYAGFVKAADAHAGATLPAEPPAAAFPDPPPSPAELDLPAAGITSVIWATGYRFDFGWVGLDVFTPDGRPVHRRGVTSVPGACFLGLPLLYKTKSSFLSGVGEDAAYLAEHIDFTRPRCTPPKEPFQETSRRPRQT
jgi:putative flavoprotein involved in K+ transport